MFEDSLSKEERHEYGAHFTSEADIQKIILPTIVRPWRERIQAADTLKDLKAAREELLNFKVLDPACGSGNFLYVAFREMKHLELDLMSKIHTNFGRKAQEETGTRSLISTKQFFGLDRNALAVELAKVTLILAKEHTIEQSKNWIESTLLPLPLEFEQPLPLDNLDENIRCEDALFVEWPKVNSIIGNPPFQSKNKIQNELGLEYVHDVRARFPDVPGRADYCVYWFRKAHDELPEGNHAGLVGTNTIRQNESREGGLDYIVKNGGTITEAVSTQEWSGDASVSVSIVNWVKGKVKGKKRLFVPSGLVEVSNINSSLSNAVDLSNAASLACNRKSNGCFQGQTHGHEAFLIKPAQAQSLIEKNPDLKDILYPFLTINDLLSTYPPAAKRFVIDFGQRSIQEASKYKECFSIIEKNVLPKRELEADSEKKRNQALRKNNPNARINHHHQNFLNKWWQLSYPRQELMDVLTPLRRYIACGQVTKRQIFEFISTDVHPNAALMVFPFEDDYSFGILQSSVHWTWFLARCSTLRQDFRYTSDTVFDSFVWPQSPKANDMKAVADAAVALRDYRRQVMREEELSYRELYRVSDLPGKNELKDHQLSLDEAVRKAYGMKKNDDILSFMLDLKMKAVDQEAKGIKLTGPGLPPGFKSSDFITKDAVNQPNS